jgi:nucleoside-diphosphate-sugar epimerase
MAGQRFRRSETPPVGEDRLVTVENVAAPLALAVTSNSAGGRVYNVVDPDARSTADFIREIGQAVGWNGRVVELPKGVLPGQWDAFRTDHHALVDSSRIRRELGYSETVPRMEALHQTIEWQRAHPREPSR